MAAFTYLKDVVTLKLDPVKCTGCRMCTIVCPHTVFEMRDRKAYIKNINYCMECGACAQNCADEAITVRAGVGCAAGILNGYFNGGDARCDSSSGQSSCC